MEFERIGRYHLIKVLGRGGFATVFLAKDPSLNDLVAIKMLSAAFSSEPGIVARFVHEARVMRNLAAPGLVTVYDSGEQDGRPYFVMEYCERGTVGDRMTRLGRTLTIEEGLGLAAAIGTAMAPVHRGTPPVVHRDLKPDNLLLRADPRRVHRPIGELVGQDEEVILGDFGLAKAVSPEATRLSLLAFTEGYAAPEQARGDPTIEPTADVYSASAIITTAISGRKPKQVFAAGEWAFDEPALTATGPLRLALERGLSYDRQCRQPEIGAWSTSMIDAATAHRGQAEQPSSTVGTREPGGRRRSRRLTIALLAVVGLALVTAGGAIVARALLADSPIVGPERGFVGDEVAFVVPDADVTSWEAAGQATDEEVLRFRPATAGEVTIEANTTDGRVALQFRVDERPSPLRIEGPGYLPIGQSIVLSASDPGASGLVWTVGGRDHGRDTLQLRPETPGLLGVVLTTGDGRRVERTFNVGP